MTAERKNIKSDIDTLDRILHLLRYKQSVFIEESNDKDFEKVTDYVESVMAKLEGKRQKMGSPAINVGASNTCHC
jgi:hypothetical protein